MSPSTIKALVLNSLPVLDNLASEGRYLLKLAEALQAAIDTNPSLVVEQDAFVPVVADWFVEAALSDERDIDAVNDAVEAVAVWIDTNAALFDDAVADLANAVVFNS